MKTILSPFCRFSRHGTGRVNRVTVGLFYILLTVGIAYGQDSVVYLGHYEMRHVKDLEAPQDTTVEHLLLFIGQQSSLWNSYTKLEYGYGYQLQVMEKANLPPEENRYYMQRAQFVIDEIYLFHDQRQHFKLGYLMDRYLFEVDYLEPEWTIGEEQQTMLGLTCQKATTTFKGREWTVWFTPEVPVNAGPWLLHGLPGLIVVAADGTGEVSFELTALTADPAEAIAADPILAFYTSTEIGLPDDPKIYKVKEQEFQRLKASGQEDFYAYFQARRKVTGFMDNEFSMSRAWVNVIKNPIALED